MIEISTDRIILLRFTAPSFGDIAVPATLVYTWALMAALVALAWAARSGRDRNGDDPAAESWPEALVAVMQGQLREIAGAAPAAMSPFVGALFLFLFSANFLSLIPGFESPAGSLSTTSALALAVFLAVPAFGVARLGLLGYLRQYLKPTPLMLPFNIIGELSRTVALSVRLYGNAMSGAVIVAVLLGIAPLLFPAAMQLLDLLTGSIQAYIFSVLAAVYIGAGLGGPSARDSESPIDPLERSSP